MGITPQNIIMHEFIGLDSEVVNHSDPSHVGIIGRIVDETKNTFKVKIKEGYRVVPKRTSVFIISLRDGKKVEIKGDILIHRPEERIKLGMKKMRRLR